MTALSNVGYFLLGNVLSLITFILWARIFIRYFAIPTFHPFTQAIYTVTAPIIIPIQKNIFRKWNTRGRYDQACILLLVIFSLLKMVLMSALVFHHMLPYVYLVLYTLVSLITEPCNLLFYAVIIRTVMSWILPYWQHPFAQLLYLVTEPLLKSIRQALPHFGMLDFSPWVAMILLKVITLFAAGMLPLSL